MIRRYWRNAALVGLSALVFGSLFRLGIALEMDRTYFSFRYLGQGQVTAALDSLVPGEPGDYMTHPGLASIAAHYWTTDHLVPLGSIIAEAADEVARERGWTGTRAMVVDDKGYILFLRLAFRLFGLHRQSVYYAYFLALGIPMVVYAAYFFGSRVHLYVLLASLVAVFVTASILTINDQLYSLHEQRFFSVVGLVPLLTILFVMSEGEFSWRALTAVTAQVGALVFVYFCRNDSLWETAVAVFALPVLFWRLRRGCSNGRALALRLVWPVALLAVGLFGLDRYKHAHFNPQYFQQGYASHAYSHNLIMGLSFNPRLAREYELGVDDAKVIRLVGRRMAARGELKTAEDAFPIFERDFNRYSVEVRAAMLDIVTTHPWESALSIVYKWQPIVDEFKYIAGYTTENVRATSSGHRLRPESDRKAWNLYYRPFRPFAVMILVVGALLTLGASVRDWSPVLLTVFMVWVGSLLVPVSSIPMMYILGPTFVTTPLLGYLGVVSAIMIQADRRRVFVPA
jgi:hypothetical protein